MRQSLSSTLSIKEEELNVYLLRLILFTGLGASILPNFECQIRKEIMNMIASEHTVY
jgi:hypothetical protein